MKFTIHYFGERVTKTKPKIEQNNFKIVLYVIITKTGGLVTNQQNVVTHDVLFYLQAFEIPYTISLIMW